MLNEIVYNKIIISIDSNDLIVVFNNIKLPTTTRTFSQWERKAIINLPKRNIRKLKIKLKRQQY